MKPTSIANPKEKIEELGRRIDHLHRSVLEPDVLRGLLPITSRLLPHRMRAPEARLREDRFRAASESYVRRLADDAAFAANARAMELDGLRWWVPILRPDGRRRGIDAEGRARGGAVLDARPLGRARGHRGRGHLVRQGRRAGIRGGGAAGYILDATDGRTDVLLFSMA